MKIRKSRFLMLHPETNPGKIQKLDQLQEEYTAYLKICVDLMIERHIFSMRRSQKMAFFPRAENLISTIEKDCRDHAIGIVSGWASSAYTNKIKQGIVDLKKGGDIDGETAKALFTIGRHSRQIPSGSITQYHIDTYWALLLLSVKPPTISDRLGIRLSQDTSCLEVFKEADHADFWLRISTLEARSRIWLPLVGSPYVEKPSDLGRGFLARKTKNGRWRFEALDTKVWEVPEPSPDAPRIGIDVGLNVLAASSDGNLYGEDLKPKFNELYEKVKKLRANRQRQGFKENSPRLDRLESKLSGLTKTTTGTVANRLVKDFPDHVFVLEDLDLRGSKGSKRFCYRGLAKSLKRKSPTEDVNPAYTSQECPSCGYISRGNRSGIHFRCRSCGRKAHADWVGASGVLRRSEDKNIGCDDRPKKVKGVLRERFLARSKISSSRLLVAGTP